MTVSLYAIVPSVGLLDKKSRQRNLKRLCLSGTEISDVGLRYITQFLSQLQILQIAGCWKLSDAGLAQLSMLESKTAESLAELDLSSCKGITNAGLHHLIRCRNLVYVNCSSTGVTHEAMKKFVEESAEKLKVHGSVIERRLSRR